MNTGDLIEQALTAAGAGQAEQAEAICRRVLDAEPSNADALYVLGIVEHARGRHADAERFLRRALEADPQAGWFHTALGEALHAQGRHAAALEEFDAAIRSSPDDADTRLRLAELRLQYGDVSDAVALFEQVLRIRPDAAPVQSQRLVTLNFDPGRLPEQIFDEHHAWAARHANPMASGTVAPPVLHDDADARLRIGYVSSDFRRHPVGDFLLRVLESHDHARHEVVCCADVKSPDEYTHRMQRAADSWVSIVGMSDEQATQVIRDRAVDVLVDLAGHTAGNRLGVFARRAAPVQVSYLGYCNTTGMTTMDWIVGDDITDPPIGGATQPYVERVLRLGNGFSCFCPPPDAPDPGELPAACNGFITFGSFHGLAKLNEVTLSLWARVLNEVPRARLLIWRHSLHEPARRRITRILEACGIGADRVEMRSDRPAGSHLSMYHHMDISLDAQPWSGHTTSCESLWMGVPFVTMIGRTHAGRMAASAVTHAGCGEFVARDEEQFVGIARQLAADAARLAELRRSVRSRMARSALCDGPRFTRAWEAALRDAWRAR